MGTRSPSSLNSEPTEELGPRRSEREKQNPDCMGIMLLTLPLFFQLSLQLSRRHSQVGRQLSGRSYEDGDGLPPIK